jgi:hypothetical protein
MLMFTITKDFLQLFPNWRSAGWAVGDKINVTDYLSSCTESIQTYINLHPPKRPGG